VENDVRSSQTEKSQNGIVDAMSLGNVQAVRLIGKGEKLSLRGLR
jgi:hypothetical protein